MDDDDGCTQKTDFEGAEAEASHALQGGRAGVTGVPALRGSEATPPRLPIVRPLPRC